MTSKDYIIFAKFHGDFIFDLYNQTKINPSDIIYIDNRSLVTRDARQKEDVKIILEF